MVSCAALSILLLLPSPSSQQDLSQYKVLARRILEKAYTASTPPADLFGTEEPEVRAGPGSVLIMYGRGSVGFSSNGTPTYFSCSAEPATHLDVPMSPAQVRERAAGFVREFRPNWPMQFEVTRMALTVRLMEEGLPHFNGGWLQVNSTTGVITHGGLPHIPPRIARRAPGKVSKESAVAEAIQTALLQHPELEIFEIERARTYWYIPEHEFASAPAHAKRAGSQKQAIKVYAVGLIGEGVGEGLDSRKNGVIFVDAETGIAISGGLMKIDSIGTTSVPPLESVKAPSNVYVNKAWRPVSSALALEKQEKTPKGESVFAMEDSAVVKGRFDSEKKILWLPSAGTWRGFRVVLGK